MPAEGRAARPSLNMRKTNSSMRLDVAELRLQEDSAEERAEERVDHPLAEAEASQRLQGRRLRPRPDFLHSPLQDVPSESRDGLLVRERSDGREQRGRQRPGLAERVRDAVELAARPHQRAGLERLEAQSLVVEHPPRLGIGGEEHLEPAVEEEAVHPVRAHASARLLRGFHEEAGDALLLEPQRAAEAGHARPDDHRLCRSAGSAFMGSGS